MILSCASLCSPLSGFSRNQIVGRVKSIISKHAKTIASAERKSCSSCSSVLPVFAALYFVHGGEHQMMSNDQRNVLDRCRLLADVSRAQ